MATGYLAHDAGPPDRKGLETIAPMIDRELVKHRSRIVTNGDLMKATTDVDRYPNRIPFAISSSQDKKPGITRRPIYLEATTQRLAPSSADVPDDAGGDEGRISESSIR